MAVLRNNSLIEVDGRRIRASELLRSEVDPIGWTGTGVT
jgi:hypothetical protein